ncbi:FAD-dependent oxidoreductase [Salipiger sp. P9]|uniref:NAD(P)/FAD-dependent oxidoreductase n=1 Tax=Salipiger pentaromativorans TaxID=2943193 RepID=UPI002157F85B|nr:FAD-dependent oxidoreductase [Salipiger pentaromativorans]MCR8547530.1 FAD-dependent oxidoreductase [Salipiger pentaromativorans]
MARHFTVLGAGTVGVCTALQLLRDGHRVTLIDRAAPASGCSYGNAGIIQVGGLVPLANPGILRQVPKMLLDPEGPLLIRWQYLPRLMPYLLRFIASARPERVAHAANALGTILDRAIEAYRPLIQQAGAWDMVRETGELYLYKTDAAYAAAASAHALRRAHGVKMEEIPVGELSQLEPCLAPIYRHALLFNDCISVRDPAVFTRRLADAFQAAGGTWIQDEITDLDSNGSGQRHLIGATGRHALDELVIATGAYSKPWARKLGSYVPLDTERGYHLMLADPGVETQRPLIFGDQKFGAVSMLGGLRIAGTAELAKLDMAPNYARAHRLLGLAKEALPDLRTDKVTPWMGHRPSTPDSLPVICRAPGRDKTYFAFGHGHLGLTMGGITGRLIADLAAGRTPPIDMAPFDIARFS